MDNETLSILANSVIRNAENGYTAVNTLLNMSREDVKTIRAMLIARTDHKSFRISTRWYEESLTLKLWKSDK